MPAKLPVTLQMYTLRDDSARDFAGTLKTVAEIGYAGVELAGYNGLAADAVKRLLDDHNLLVSGMHTGLETLENGFDQVVADALTLGLEYVIVPYLADNRRQSIDDYRRVANALNGFGDRLKTNNLQLCYHNHAFEFEKFGGDKYGFEVLFDESDPHLVKVEMDAFWVVKAGEDPSAYLRKYAGRVPLIHIKDMTPAPESTFAEVGEGVIDFTPIFEAAEVAGTEYYVVEQDQTFKHPPLEAVRISFENLKKMGMIEA
ncbi:MAG: sugar phosphate isomerase/epimerase [Cytophagales bacterium]|nr:sugar phosphate isomerase/epimerase [Armatimonadota bacterium]